MFCCRPVSTNALYNATAEPPSVHPVVFDVIDADSIKRAALHTDGAAGPSGVDACGWRRLCASFHSASNDLCQSLALLARRVCTEFVCPEGLMAFTACRLIALDKGPGVRPIGILVRFPGVLLPRLFYQSLVGTSRRQLVHFNSAQGRPQELRLQCKP